MRARCRWTLRSRPRSGLAGLVDDLEQKVVMGQAESPDAVEIQRRVASAVRTRPGAVPHPVVMKVSGPNGRMDVV